MNYEEAKGKFIQAWGALGSNWGINRTMAQVHALLLMSTQPLSTEEVMQELNVSRGNANMNLRALMDWGLISKELVPGDRKEYFKAEKDMLSVARIIVRERQKREIKPVLKTLEEIAAIQAEGPEAKELKRVTTDMKEVTEKLDGLAERFSKSDENWFYKVLLSLIR